MTSSSTIITCLHSALLDADFLLNNQYEESLFERLRSNLKMLKAFVLCARKLRNNASFGSFLPRIEDFLLKKAEELHACCSDVNAEGSDHHSTDDDVQELHVSCDLDVIPEAIDHHSSNDDVQELHASSAHCHGSIDVIKDLHASSFLHVNPEATDPDSSNIAVVQLYVSSGCDMNSEATDPYCADGGVLELSTSSDLDVNSEATDHHSSSDSLNESHASSDLAVISEATELYVDDDDFKRSLNSSSVAVYSNSSESDSYGSDDILQQLHDDMVSDSLEDSFNTFWPVVYSVVNDIMEFIQSLVEEMDVWYVIMLDCMPQLTTSLMANDVLEIITYILEHLESSQAIELESMREQLIFLRSLIHFVTMGSVEARDDLFSHADNIAVNAAYLLLLCRDRNSEISALVQKMKPTDPQVSEIYIQSLSSSKLSRHLLAPTNDEVDDAFIAVKNFLTSLISNLWDMLGLNTHISVSMKDQLQELYGDLRSLRTLLSEQPIAIFDMKIHGMIADVVCDAAISICSFYQAHIDPDPGLQKLLGALKTVLAESGDRDPQMPIFNSPRSSAYGFVDYILEKLMDLTRCEAESAFKSHVQTILVEFGFVRSSLETVVDLRYEHEEIQKLWDRLLELAYVVENVIDELVMVSPLPEFFLTSLVSIIKGIGSIKADVLKIKVREERNRINHHVPSQTTQSVSNEVIGFHNEERSALHRLKSGSKQLQIIAIVGMPGVGKSTLATKVYNDSSIPLHFSVRAWCPISQVLDKQKVLIDLLRQIDPDMFLNMSSEMDEHDLANKLRCKLKGKRYIIFLDDIWNTDSWNSMKDSFPDDSKGSRIIVTSRSHEMLDQEPLFLSPLSMDDSLVLLQRKLFPGEGNYWPPELHDVGMQMAEKCKGLPLTIIILAGVLATMAPENWEEMLDDLSFVSSADYCKYTLELSYKHLPDYLKPCFLYFGVFPEDQEVRVRRLLRLWIAEGFVRKCETKSLEDVAEGYLKILIGRSLIVAVAQRSDGGLKTCRIHDFLRDFCLEKAKHEHFFHFLKGHDELLSFNETQSLRRLYIDSTPRCFQESKIFCPHARSLLLSCSKESRTEVYRGMSFMHHGFKLLRLLDLEKISVGSEFPSGIQQLVLLTFLAIGGNDLGIPPWIANLSNLESFIIDPGHGIIQFPDSLWNMQKLVYLYIRCHRYSVGGGILPVDNLGDSSILYELNRFSGAVFRWSLMEKQLSKFPKVRKLKCRLLLFKDDTENVDKFKFPYFLSQLESLHMSANPGHDFKVRFDFTSLKHLKKLVLSKFDFYEEIFSIIGYQLPKLEILKLKGLIINGKNKYTWEMKEGEFSKLRILHLDHMTICKWRACDDHEFVCFQKLILDHCYELVELPSCLESIETLEMIELRTCPVRVENLVKRIEKVQREWGNFGLKINLLSFWD